jgi:hypothetical protein
MGMDSLCTTNQDFGPKNVLSNLMDQIDTASQVNGLSIHFTLSKKCYRPLIQMRHKPDDRI